MFFTFNPFAAFGAFVSPAIMQGFVIVMVVLVFAGTLFDMLHKRSAAYFFENRRKVRARAQHAVNGSQKVLLAVETAAEALVSGEFCNARRRVAHLIAMYGFIAYVVATIAMVFWYARPNVHTPAILPLLWHIGALMICIGGYWFWFFIRVDVAAEGHSRVRLVQADLFIVSLLANATLALIWSWLFAQHSDFAILALLLYLASALFLFGSVPWSKFSHVFYKPAAAFDRRVEEASGTRRNLPLPADIPETFDRAPERPQRY
jgi:hypothetical protein